MKASQFIKVALIDQMQIIADAGLWYHLVPLMIKGLNTIKVRMDGGIQPPFFDLERRYKKLPKVGECFGVEKDKKPEILLVSGDEDAHLNATYGAESGAYYIHVPTLFKDYKELCSSFVEAFERGVMTDFEFFPEKTQDQ